jgi:hypothetical protein
VKPANAATAIREACAVYAAHATTVIGVSALIQLVYVVVGFVLLNHFGLTVGLALMSPLGLVVSQLTIGVYTTLLLHVRTDHEVPSIGSLLTAVLPKLFPLLGLAILCSICIGIGFILLVIPGIYIALRLAVAAPAKVAGGLSITDAMSSSWGLTKGSLFTTFVVMLFQGALSIAIPELASQMADGVIENYLLAVAFLTLFIGPLGALALGDLFFQLSGYHPAGTDPGYPTGPTSRVFVPGGATAGASYGAAAGAPAYGAPGGAPAYAVPGGPAPYGGIASQPVPGGPTFIRQPAGALPAAMEQARQAWAPAPATTDPLARGQQPYGAQPAAYGAPPTHGRAPAHTPQPGPYTGPAAYGQPAAHAHHPAHGSATPGDPGLAAWSRPHVPGAPQASAAHAENAPSHQPSASPQPYAAPAQPNAAPPQPYAASPQAYATPPQSPQPYAGQPQPYAGQPAPQPYAPQPQPYAPQPAAPYAPAPAAAPPTPAPATAPVAAAMPPATPAPAAAPSAPYQAAAPYQPTPVAPPAPPHAAPPYGAPGPHQAPPQRSGSVPPPGLG